MTPDIFYCIRLLEEAGVLTRPGCDFGQKEGSHHIRYDAFTSLARIYGKHTFRRMNGKCYSSVTVCSCCRFCIMTPVDVMEELLRRLSSFHTQFMKEFS